MVNCRRPIYEHYFQNFEVFYKLTCTYYRSNLPEQIYKNV